MKKRMLWVLASLMICGLATVTMTSCSSDDSPYEEPDPQPVWPEVIDYSQWMKYLTNNRLVADLSLPGAHDAVTAEGWNGSAMEFIGLLTATTQDLTILQQLEKGVRVFDLRPELVENKENGTYELRCSHGVASTKLLVVDFFRKLKDYLASKPSEFCILTVELSATKDKEVWAKEFNALVNSSEFKGLFADFKPRLTVGEMRGHVLMLSREEYAEKPLGGYCYGWTDELELEKQTQGYILGPDGSKAPLWVQDFWGKVRRTGKDEAIVRMLEAAVKRDMEAEAPVWVINFPSAYFGTPSSDSYRENAALSNVVTIEWLAEHDGPVGIIYMDFAGVDTSIAYNGTDVFNVAGLKLVESVVKQNAKREHPK